MHADAAGQSSNQYGDAGQEGTVDYIDDAQIFEYDHGGHGGSSGQQNGVYADHGGQAQQTRTRNYYDYEPADDKRRRGDDDEDMW